MLQTELPMYLIHSYELPHRGDGALFHFTKADSFFKILEDLTLLPSSFDNLNDLNEGNIHNMGMNKNFMVMYNAEKYIKERCHLISFSQNYEKEGFGIEGSNHPAMWGHYAENSDGVCLVIDKESFISKNQTILDGHFHKFADVKYSMFNTPDDDAIDTNVKTPEEFIQKNWQGLFFLKHEDWKNEDEHRLFIMDYDGKMSIDGCIKYIVLGRKFFLNDGKIKQLTDLIINPNSICYKKFVPHSFATTCYDSHGYSTYEIAFKIHGIIQKYSLTDRLYKEYDEWLHNEQGYG